MDESNRVAFDLAHANLQSITRAQRFYLSSLLVYLCLVWGWFFVGSGETVTIQMLGATIKTSGFWKITPLVTTLLTLGLIGSINAAGPAWRRLRETLWYLGIASSEPRVVFHQLDTHKNIFDYFTYLRLHPEKPAQGMRSARFDFRHFLYPSLYAASIYTTYRATREAFTFGDRWLHSGFQIYALVCLGFQIAYSVRPFWRAFCRFLGLRTDKVYE